MRKKLLTCMLALTLTLSTFTGCTSDTGSETVKADTEQQQMEEPEVEEPQTEEPQAEESQTEESQDGIPAFSGQPYVAVNNNVPYFTEDEITDQSYETYGALDTLGRCTYTEACIGEDLMPTEQRGNIGQVKPTGWHSVKYDFVEGKSLYNRCHLIGFQLTAENANKSNLITGTRYLNIEGMLPFENMTADYVKETGNHVMYRSTPIFRGENLVADGVLMEGYSVEDEGEGVLFCVYAYNVQPGVHIDYATGDSYAEDGTTQKEAGKETADYVINKNTGKFHKPDCSSAERTKAENRIDFTGTREELISQGYEPCGKCHP